MSDKDLMADYAARFERTERDMLRTDLAGARRERDALRAENDRLRSWLQHVAENADGPLYNFAMRAMEGAPAPGAAPAKDA